MKGDKRGTVYVGLQLVDGYELLADDKITETLFQHVGALRHFDLRPNVGFCFLIIESS